MSYQMVNSLSMDIMQDVVKDSVLYVDRLKTDEDFMRFAISLSKKAAKKDEVPIGAVVVLNGKVVSFAHRAVVGT